VLDGVRRSAGWRKFQGRRRRGHPALKHRGPPPKLPRMHTSIIVVDDFFGAADAHRLRDAGLGCTYPEQDGAFPGRNSLERLGIDGLDDIASRLTGERLRPVSPPQSHAKFRMTLGADRGRAKVHIDHGAYWSGILYLSRPEDCRGGTEFFRHLPTGTERAPLNDDELKAMGFTSQEQMHQQVIEKDSNDDSKWEMTMRVPMRFNRLLLLRPWQWHTAGEAFGDSPDNARLVYLMFFAPV